jgi:uncharacterized protein YmfQ (DUF2313 family)
VNGPLVGGVSFFRAGLSAAGDPLESAGNAELQCVLALLKPAHTVIKYNLT